MSSEIRLAFEHPIARSENGAPEVHDRISLRDHIVEVDIGAFQQERGKTQRICFNIVVEVCPVQQVSDDVDRILSYDKVSEAIAFELSKERLNLLETLADRVAQRILFEPQAIRVFVRIEKLDRGPGALGVEIVRSRTDLPQESYNWVSNVARPQIICLSSDALVSDHLINWLDHLSLATTPSILCVDLPREAMNLTSQPLVNRRIELLAVEKNAWILASKDERCVVVSSKTELDWAIKQNKICVWAPSKMVLDATQPPKYPVSDMLGIALWLSGALNATHIYAIGEFESLVNDPIIHRRPIGCSPF